jgi:hypothetical protein
MNPAISIIVAHILERCTSGAWVLDPDNIRRTLDDAYAVFQESR